MDLTSGSVTAIVTPVKRQKGAAVNRAFLHFVIWPIGSDG